MEALSIAVVPLRPEGAYLPADRHYSFSASLSKSHTVRYASLRARDVLEALRISWWAHETRRDFKNCLCALPGNADIVGGGEGANGFSGNSFGFASSEALISSENDNPKNERLENTVVDNQANGIGGTTTSRAGLFRTPISGGVHSATIAHDLPPPALAVRNLMEQARFGHLCTVMSRMHHRRVGYPFGSLVDFAPDLMGHPIFSLSPLAIHTRNLLENPKCTLNVQIPGWSGLSNARVTIFGDIGPLSADLQDWARQQFVAKHQQWASQQWGNFHYFRMQNISDIYFIGGFGTVAWVDAREYEALQPDKIAVDGAEQNLKELNAYFSKPLKKILSTDGEIDDAAFISIDSKGTDIRVRQGAQFNIQRLSFEVEHKVETLEEAKKALQRIIDRTTNTKLAS